jgi:3-oxoacyl-[acyl-carrier protein] reductase
MNNKLGQSVAVPGEGPGVPTAQPENAIAVGEEIRRFYGHDLLAGKVALVTGASRGIGRCIAVAYGALGAKVIVNHIVGTENDAAETARIIEKFGGKAHLSCFDVSNFTQTQEAFKELEKEVGGVDILVNNAGISRDNLLARMKEDEWDSTIAINLKGTFNCSRAAIMGMMKKRSGKIVNISSVIGLVGNAGQAAYAASKAGILGLTKSVAKEVASRNIQVNAIAPGYISTSMTAALGEKLIQDVMAKIPSSRLGECTDIAKAAVFLGSPLSDYVTGQTLAVDGGMTM